MNKMKFVAVDVETTGLDPFVDEIIEVAAVRFCGDEIEEEFSTLIDPGLAIPPFITKLTGINEQMVLGQPSIRRVKRQVEQVLGDCILVGHNIDFDLGFLRQANIGVGYQRLDTVVLSRILFPNAGRYGLETLAHYLELPGGGRPQTHRALDDVHLNIELFYRLWEEAMKMDVDILGEIVQTGRTMGWVEVNFFGAVLDERIEAGEKVVAGFKSQLFTPPPIGGVPLVEVEDQVPLDMEIVTGMIRPGGQFSREFPNFEYREQQVEMMEAVGEAFNNGEHLLVEAGTGTGKSVGYLLPAAFWAVENGRPVVISTNTINLQDQLLDKDIPALQKILPFKLQVAVRKGRRNYLCTRLFKNMRHRGPSNNDEMGIYARILNWLPQSETGDVGELNLRSTGEQISWSRLSAENDACKGDECAQSRCPLFIAKRKAELAHILIVNHSLLLSDVANNNHVLPPFSHLIIDEAHHLESAVTDSLSFQADQRYLETLLNELIKPRAGLLSEVQSKVRNEANPQISQIIDGYGESLRGFANQVANQLEDFFTAISIFLKPHIPSYVKYSQQVRITTAVRSDSSFDLVVEAWKTFEPSFKIMNKELGKLRTGIDDILESVDIADGEDMQLALASLEKDLEKIRKEIAGLILEPDEKMIYWVDWFKDRISLRAAPLHVGPLVEQHLFDEKEVVVLTSATMRTAEGGWGTKSTFKYIKDRLHATEANELAVGSPFNYKESSLIYLPKDMPEPNQPGYQRGVERAILEVSAALEGRTMVLFTSYSQLDITAKAIEAELNELGISLLAQSQGQSRQQLLKQFKKPGAKAVLLGTKSFWEGVDVPGSSLQAVLLAKFPFDVPSDPIFAARSETFNNSFADYSIPEAVLRFRQGFGRLIRRKDDEGIIVILDKRIMTKRYGQAFLDALPESVVIRQPIDRLSELTKRWFNRERKQA